MRHRIALNANVVRGWIVQRRTGVLVPIGGGAPGMLPVTVLSSGKLPALARAVMKPPGSKHSPVGVIEIEPDAARIRVRGAVDGAALRAVLETLARG